jgi:hypothetical protein
MSKITKVPAPNTNGLYVVCIDGDPVGYPITEEAANHKIERLIERLSKPSDREPSEFIR